jgi:hypothetical protein
MAHTEDHDMENTTASQPVNLALRSSSSNANAPSDNAKETTTTQAETPSSSADSDSDDASTSDSDSEDAPEEEEQIPTLKPGTKPDFSSARALAAGAPSLADRLKAFLPQMAEANSKLQQGGENEYSMEVVGEDEPHIEMDLGLGVLEETKGDQDSDDDDDDNEEEGGSPDKKKKEKDVMGKLMGKKENQTAGIEEVG